MPMEKNMIISKQLSNTLDIFGVSLAITPTIKAFFYSYESTYLFEEKQDMD
jgi:hypothetical protein